MARLKDQKVVITGGASGLGLAVVERFTDEGAKVAVLDRDEAALNNMSVPGFVCDVRDPEAVADAVDQAVDELGGLDCAIGNAGIWDYNRRLDSLPVAELADAFREMFDINVLGYIALAKACLPELVRSRGSVIFTVSNAGYGASGGGALYTGSKHAVVGLVRQLAYEFAPAVRVNGVAPGPMETQLRGPEALHMSERTIDELALAESTASILPIGRIPTLAEYAGSFVHLACRDDSAGTTGDVIKVDCGIGIRGMALPAIGAGLIEKYEDE